MGAVLSFSNVDVLVGGWWFSFSLEVVVNKLAGSLEEVGVWFAELVDFHLLVER